MGGKRMTMLIIFCILIIIILAGAWVAKQNRETGEDFNGPYYIGNEDNHFSDYPETEEEEDEAVRIVNNEDMVRVKDYIQDIKIELKYACDDNFTHEVIYDFNEAYLRYGTVKRLINAQEKFKAQGYYIKIWDAFRPVDAQFKLWEVYPDATFVADPRNGFSSHSRGNTLDITLVTFDNEEVEMPTGFDDFSDKAKRQYTDISEEAKRNALLMENIMEDEGFIPYENEWWHFSDIDEYPVEDDFRIEEL